LVTVKNLPLRNQKPRFFYGYVVVGAAFFIMMITYGAMYTFGIFFEPVLVDFGWTRAMTAGAFSLFMVFHGFLYIVTGRLNDRFGPRAVMTVCSLFLGTGYLLMSRVSTIWQLYLFYGVIIAIGVSGAGVPLMSTVARWFVLRRGLMTGIVMAGIGVGTMVMPPVANWLIYSYDWRTSYIIVGGIVLVFTLLAAQFLRRDPYQMGLLPYGASKVDNEIGAEAQGDSGLSLSNALRTRQFWLFCGIFCGFMFSLQAVMIHIVIYATGLGITPTSAANIMVIIGGLTVAGRVIIGTTADRIGNKLTLAISLALMSLAVFWLVTAKEIWSLYLFAAIFGFTYGGFAALNSPMVAELFGLRAHGVILGIIAFCGSIGGGIGPVVAGYIFDVRDSYQLAFLISGTVAAVVATLVLMLGPIVGGGETNNRVKST